MASVGTLHVTITNAAELAELTAANSAVVAAHQRFETALAAFAETIDVVSGAPSETPSQEPSSPA